MRSCPLPRIIGSFFGLLLVSGCAMVEKKDPNVVPPVVIETTEDGVTTRMTIFELQSRVMSFSDGFNLALDQQVDKLQSSMGPEHDAALLRWKVSHANGAVILASGPNPIVNLLDLAGMATLARMVMEDYWVPQVLGDAGKPLLSFHQRYEDEIWNIADEVLIREDIDALRALVQRWHDDHPDQRYASFVSISDYARQRFQSPIQSDIKSKRNLFRLLYLDPLAGIDPATKQIQQTRYTAERMFFYLERMPTLLRLHSEVLFSELTQGPTLKQLSRDVSGFRAVAEDLSRTAEALPADIVKQQEKFLESVIAQNEEMKALLADVQGTLKAGGQMAQSVNEAVKSLHAFTESVQPDSPRVEGRPFDVRDYADTASEITRASRELTTAIESLQSLVESPAWDQRATVVRDFTRDVNTKSEALLNLAFWRALVLILVFLVGLLLVRWMSRPTS